MRPQRSVRQALGLGLLMALVVLALSACGEARRKPRPVPYRRILKPCDPANTARKSSSLHPPSGSAKAGKTNHLSCPMTWLSHEER